MNIRQTSHPLAHLGRGNLDSDSEFVYDPAGRLASAVFSPAYHVAFHPDIIVNIPEAPSTEVSYSRDPAGRLVSSQLSNGVSTAFSHDPAGRLAGIAASNPLLQQEPYVNRSISRNAAGMIVALEDALPPPSDPAAPPLMSELTEFSYDDMGRLTAALLRNRLPPGCRAKGTPISAAG